MIASLPMYDLPGGDWRYDELWSDIRDALRARGVDAPEALTRSGDPAADWARDDLLLSQTCGLPFRHHLHERLTLVAAPAFLLPDHHPDCPPDPRRPTDLPAGQYYSVIVARADDPRTTFSDFDGARLAYNEPLSQSGWGLMSAHAARHGVSFGSGLRTGAHRASALAVLKGRADLAAIDVATFHGPLAQDRWRRELRIIDRTALSPALPYVTAFADLADTLFEAMRSTMAYDAADPRDIPPLQDSLNIAPEGVVRADRAAYMAIPLPPDPPAEIPGSRG